MAAYALILFVIMVGLLLILLDIIAIPGGIIAAGGILIITGTLVYSFNTYGAAFTANVGVFTAVIATVMGRIVWKYKPWRIMQLKAQENKEDGFVSHSLKKKELLDKECETYSVLRPSGKIKIHGRKYDAVTEGGMLEKGTAVKVVDVRGAQVVVRKVG